MANIVEIADHMINMVEDYAEIMGVEVVIEAESRGDQIILTVEIMKEPI
jgi:hypothetical protein